MRRGSSCEGRPDRRRGPGCTRRAGRTGRSGSCRRWARSTTGHLSLLRAARAESDAVVMSLFVNPAQFSEETDLAAYPSDFERDRELAERAGVDVLFAPAPQALYPPGFQTWVDVTELGAVLEGQFRPGHFRGVATICLKLFNLVRPRARLLRPEGRAAGRRAPADDPGPRPGGGAAGAPDRARLRRARALVPEHAPDRGGARGALSPSPAPSPPATATPPSRRSTASTSTTSRCSRSTRPSSPARSASAPSA